MDVKMLIVSDHATAANGQCLQTVDLSRGIEQGEYRRLAIQSPSILRDLVTNFAVAGSAALAPIDIVTITFGFVTRSSWAD